MNRTIHIMSSTILITMPNVTWTQTRVLGAGAYLEISYIKSKNKRFVDMYPKSNMGEGIH